MDHLEFSRRGGKARANSLSPERRKEIARMGYEKNRANMFKPKRRRRPKRPKN